MKRRSQKGSLAIFLCIVLSAAMLLNSILLSAASLKAAQVDLNRALSAQARTALACYDKSARSFGLFGFGADAADPSVFRDTLPDWLQDCTVDSKVSGQLTSPEVLSHQISRHMKGRLPVVYLDMIVSRLDGLKSTVLLPAPAQSDQSGKGLTVSMSDPDGFSLQSIIENAFDGFDAGDMSGLVQLVAGPLLDELENQLMIKLRDYYRQLASELGAVSDQGLLQIMGDQSNILDPAALSSLAGHVDDLLDLQTGQVYDKLSLIEYILGYFRQSVDVQMIKGVRTDLLSLDGRRFASMPSERHSEAEQILTGIGKPDQAELAVQTVMTLLRAVIHIVWILTDSSQMNEISLMATAVSAAVAAVSCGALVIDPKAMTYLIVAGKAIGSGLSDRTALMDGRSVQFWPGPSPINVELFYQDYLRLFFLVVPQKSLTDRTGKILDKLLPRKLFTRIEVSAVYRDRLFEQSCCYR